MKEFVMVNMSEKGWDYEKARGYLLGNTDYLTTDKILLKIRHERDQELNSV